MVVGVPEDSISDLHFSPVADYLAAGSWDNSVRIWEVSPSGSTVGKVMYKHEAPVLSVNFSKVYKSVNPRMALSYFQVEPTK